MKEENNLHGINDNMFQLEGHGMIRRRRMCALKSNLFCNNKPKRIHYSSYASSRSFKTWINHIQEMRKVRWGSIILGKNLGVVDGYLEKREERKKKERAPPKAAFSNTKKRKKEASFVQI